VERDDDDAERRLTKATLAARFAVNVGSLGRWALAVVVAAVAKRRERVLSAIFMAPLFCVLL